MPPLCCSHPLGQAWCPNLNNPESTCLTLERVKTYNIPDAEVAQVVEQRTENPRVSGSTPLLGTNYEVVEQNQVGSRTPPRKGGTASWVSAPKWRKGRRDSLKNCWGATSVSVRIRPSAPEIANIYIADRGELGEREENKLDIILQGALCRNEQP